MDPVNFFDDQADELTRLRRIEARLIEAIEVERLRVKDLMIDPRCRTDAWALAEYALGLPENAAALHRYSTIRERYINRVKQQQDRPA